MSLAKCPDHPLIQLVYADTRITCFHSAHLGKELAGRWGIRCPWCYSVSYNPDDIREGYCGKCRDWTSPRLRVRR